MIKRILLIAFACLTIGSCKHEAKPEIKTVGINDTAFATTDLAVNYSKAEFKIDGMTCAVGCAATIQKNLAKMDGVKSAKVDFDNRLAMVEYNEDKINLNDLETTVHKTSDVYKVSEIKNVEEFEENAAIKKECAKDCKKECCTKKE